MTSLISKDASLVEKLAVAFEKSTKDLLNLDSKKVACEFLSQERIVEQIELFKKTVNKFYKFDFKGKKLLEIGSAAGSMIVIARRDYGIEAYGIEPSSDEFSSFNQISTALLQEYNLPKDIIKNAVGEDLPFEDNSFDLIYSTNVLEHVNNPKKVISESLRVLKKGGFLQFVIPNYFSFWEGHYGIIWPCITNKSLGKAYVKLIGRNPQYVDTLQLISPFYLKKILNEYRGRIEILDWGKSVFKDRLTSGNYSDWASLQRIRPIIQIVQKLKMSTLAANILNAFEMYTPVVLTLRKV